MARSKQFLLITVIVLIAAALRGCAAVRLPVDFDEPVYFRAGQRLAAAVRSGDLDRLVNADAAPEHPDLVKLLYAAVFLRYPPAPEVPEYPADLSPPQFAPYVDQIGAMGTAARLSSAVFGALNVLLVALVSPAAGALLAIHTYTVKYTAQIYLEALPMFTATVAVLAYIRALDGQMEREKGRRGEGEQGSRGDAISPSPFPPFSLSPPLWWAASAVALGLTAAGKYVYAVAGIAIAFDYLWRWGVAKGGKGEREKGRKGEGDAPLLPRTPAPLLPLLAWGLLSLLVFYAANPTLWPDPAGRLVESLAFHAAYSQGEQVARSGYPWWQPFVWLFTPQPTFWHPTVIITPLDGLTAALGVIGAPVVWRARRVVVLWWAVGLAFLLLWSTKWPQYSLIMTVPVCLCAAEGLRWLRERLERWGSSE